MHDANNPGGLAQIAAIESQMEPVGKIEIARYLEAVQKRWPLVVAVVVAAFALGAIYTLKSPKLYKSSANLIISSQTPQVLTGVQDLAPTGSPHWDEGFLQTEYKVLSSRAVAERAAEKLGLRYDDKRNGLEKIKDPTEREEQRKQFDALAFVSRHMTMNPTKRSRVVAIDVIYPEPQFAADLANAIATSYMELNVEKRHDGTRDAGTWLAVQHDELRKKLNASEDVLYEFMDRKEILNASLESQMAEVKSRLEQFITKLAEVQARRIADRVDAQAVKDVYENPGLIDSIPQIQQAQVITNLKTKLTELITEYSEYSERYLPAHPKMKALQEQIASMQRNLKREVDATIEMLEREQRALAMTEEGLAVAISKERSREAHLNKLSLDYGRLKREVETNSRLYELVTGRLKEINLTGMLQANNVRLLDAAQVPRAPFRPNWILNFLLSLGLGLFLGVGLALFLDMIDTSLKNQEDVEQALGLPFLGVMPVIAVDSTKRSNRKKSKRVEQDDLRERDLYILHHPKSMPAECSRAIRTNLLFMSPDRPLKSLSVTSAMPREGKSTTAISLATTMAHAGSRVLLVDADLRRPRLHKSFGLPNEVGLSSAIVNEATLDDAIQHSELPGLDLLFCGPIPPNPAELLHTSRFKELLAELENRYDKVIFDAPPVGAVTDPVILGTHVDGTIMIVKTATTDRETVRQALRSLVDARVHVFGVILNDVEISAKKYGYYYGKYYRYGRYYGQYGETSELASSPA